MPSAKETAKEVANDAVYTVINALGSVTGLWGKFYNDRLLSNSSVEKQIERVQSHLDSIGLSKELPGADLFDKYAEGRARNADAFVKLKAPDDVTLTEKLKEVKPATAAAADVAAAVATNAPKIAIKTAISDALMITAETTAARREYAASINRVKQLMQSTDSLFTPRKQEAELYRIRNRAHVAIENQHAHETTALTNKFAEPAFIQNINECFGLVDDDQRNALKASMLATLKESQDKELAAFDKGVNEPISKMHEGAQVENRRVALLAEWYQQQNNQAFRNEINKLHAANKKAEGLSVEAEYDGENDSALFKGIDIKDLKTIKTVTGLPVTNSGDGTFSIKLPNRIFGVGYYMSGHNNSKADLMTIAQAVKASGYSKITMTFKHPDKDHAMEGARKFYEACRETGFDDKNITIQVNINGEIKKMTSSELFADCPSRLRATEATAAKNAKTWADTENGLSETHSLESYKSTLSNGRAAAAAATAAPVVDPLHQAPAPGLA